MVMLIEYKTTGVDKRREDEAEARQRLESDSFVVA